MTLAPIKNKNDLLYNNLSTLCTNFRKQKNNHMIVWNEISKKTTPFSPSLRLFKYFHNISDRFEIVFLPFLFVSLCVFVTQKIAAALVQESTAVYAKCLLYIQCTDREKRARNYQKVPQQNKKRWYNPLPFDFADGLRWNCTTQPQSYTQQRMQMLSYTHIEQSRCSNVSLCYFARFSFFFFLLFPIPPATPTYRARAPNIARVLFNPLRVLSTSLRVCFVWTIAPHNTRSVQE